MGLAVDDIKAIQDDATLKRLELQVICVLDVSYYDWYTYK